MGHESPSRHEASYEPIVQSRAEDRFYWSTSSRLHSNPDHGVVLSLSTPTHTLQDGSTSTASYRPGTETKAAVKTTEFVVYLVAVAGVLIASFLVGDADGGGDGGGGVFLADRAWFYVTLLTIGYLISRGLAKAGGRAHHNAWATSGRPAR